MRLREARIVEQFAHCRQALPVKVVRAQKKTQPHISAPQQNKSIHRRNFLLPRLPSNRLSAVVAHTDACTGELGVVLLAVNIAISVFSILPLLQRFVACGTHKAVYVIRALAASRDNFALCDERVACMAQRRFRGRHKRRNSSSRYDRSGCWLSRLHRECCGAVDNGFNRLTIRWCDGLHLHEHEQVCNILPIAFHCACCFLSTFCMPHTWHINNNCLHQKAHTRHNADMAARPHHPSSRPPSARAVSPTFQSYVRHAIGIARIGLLGPQHVAREESPKVRPKREKSAAQPNATRAQRARVRT